MQKFDFTDKVAIVTGGGGGIGRAQFLPTLCENGAKVVVVDLSEEAGMVTVNKIKEKNGEAIFVKADVTKEEDIKSYVKKTIDTYGKIEYFSKQRRLGRKDCFTC